MVVPTTSTTTTFAPTTLSTTPTSRPLLPRYKGKQIDDSDLLEAIDRANHRLSEVSDLVNSISDQITKTAPLDGHDSARPTRITSHERLGTSLVITTTPEGRIVHFKATPLGGCLPHGLSNMADQVSRYTRWLFKMIDLSPRQPDATSTSLYQHGLRPYSAGGQYYQPEFKHGLCSHRGLTPRRQRLRLGSSPIPPGFLPLPGVSPHRGDLVLNVSNDKPVLDGETDDQR